jgi:hypothetical protein
MIVDKIPKESVKQDIENREYIECRFCGIRLSAFYTDDIAYMASAMGWLLLIETNEIICPFCFSFMKNELQDEE